MFLLMRDSPRKGKRNISFKPFSAAMGTGRRRISMSNRPPFPVRAFPYELLFQAEIHSPTLPSRVARWTITPRSFCRGGRFFPFRNCKEHDCNHIATNASGTPSGMRVSIRMVRTNPHTAQRKGGCHWDACSTDERPNVTSRCAEYA